ncbi:hypothetical protein [Ulvibacter litoralis]|uniref:Phosphoribosyl transferase domain-containing protein n=1 Tax=Ulvibacter litoralis TaxID=227084 RepID=A0A1G7HGL7_9FLAO|nr:hypothetical protein [Ulvibacter litoralis]GHC57641.1 hypothetical protein GCM10008083_22780 [Ulvibacter litoralis]SDE99179.1 hypothetical protein SAMN05421855_10464 [Ulvibacter litoralis]
MKLLITSPDAIYDWYNETFFNGIIDALNSFRDASDDNEIVLISNHESKLKIVPKNFTAINLSPYKRLRKSPKLITIISKKLGVEFEDIIILGAKDDDMILAANTKLILLTAVYAQINNFEDRIYKDKYGIAIHDNIRLQYFFDHYIDIVKPWFFSYDISDNCKIYGLTNAMTGLMANSTEIQICNHLKKHLKDGHDEGQNPFRIFSLLSAYRIFPEIDDIYLWACYPTSTGLPDEPLLAIKEILRKSFGSRASKDLFIRHKPSPKRSNQGANTRANQGCDNQFNSIHLNPYYKGKIEGKSICIIDDFSTHGTSCETVRHLLNHAGVSKVVFIALGKYKVTYKTYDYTLSGNVYDSTYTFQRNGTYTENHGVLNNDSSGELLDSLKDSFL